MANKGLKNYTKQISGNVGSVKYHINPSPLDSNIILTIPLLQSKCLCPIGLSLIYSYQDRNSMYGFGKGFKCNYDTRIIDDGTNLRVNNADFSVDTYHYDNVNDLYYFKENGNTIDKTVTNVDGDSEEVNYLLLDKYGNRTYFDSSCCIKRIENVKGDVINYYPESGVMVDNNKGSQITYLNNPDYRVNSISLRETISESIIEQAKVDFEYENGYLTLLTIKYADEVVEKYSFTYSETSIGIFDEIKKYNVIIVHSGNSIFVNHEYHDVLNDTFDLITEPNITISNNKAIVSYLDNKSSTIVYDDNGILLYEYDNKNNLIVYEYNDNYLLTYQSAVMNMNNINNMDSVLTAPITSTDLIYSTSTSLDEAPALFGFNQMRTIESQSEDEDGEDIYELTYSGDKKDLVTLIAYVKQNEGIVDNKYANIQVSLLDQDNVVGSKTYSFNKDTADSVGRFIVLGVIPKSNFNKIKVWVRTLGVSISYSDIKICKHDFGVYYTYDSNNNVISILSGVSNTSINYDESNQVKSVSNGNNEIVYQYDENMNPVKAVGAYNSRITMEYDDFNRMIKKSTKYTNGYVYEEEYVYDDNNNVIEINDNTTNSNEFEYDNYHRLQMAEKDFVSTEFTYGDFSEIEDIVVNDVTSSSVLDEITHTYNSNHNLITVDKLNSGEYEFEYNNKNLLTKVTLGGLTLVEYEYDYLSRLIKKKYSNNSYYEFVYSNSRLSIIKYNGSVRYTLGYDTLDRLITITNNLNETITYTYDNYNLLLNLL